MANIQWGHVFIWIGIGFILLLTGIIISSIRRSLRQGQLSKIPRKAMTAFKQGFVSKRMMATINEQLEASWETKLASAPPPPTKSLWGWSPPGGSLGDVNYQHVIVASPRLIEHAARVHSHGAWARHPSQSAEDYLLMISSQLPVIPEDVINGYLDVYTMVQFDKIEINKRQYTEWLRNLTSILQVLDQTTYKMVNLAEQEATSSNREPKKSNKRRKAKKSES